ncbi:MAG: bifunctional oligoribonuclease/PAP phosphatase NrnA [Oscillospiraceae bacterium]|nr:bifunctional oligoribonuclease/PAP phosphatase NrnA [Oscillospiraceae bacterium]
MTIQETAEFLCAHDNYLILTHRRPDGDTIGCAAALCTALRQMGKTAGVLYNRETTEHFAPYIEELWVADDFDYETVVSVDLAALNLFPDNAEQFKTRVDLAIDHHPSYERFGKHDCVHPECAACGEVVYELAARLGQLTAAVALPLYVAVSTDTGCFVYSNVTANTHRVAAALMETGIDYKAANKLHFRTKSKKRLALEGELMRTMEFYDENRVVVVTLPMELQRRLALTEADMEDISALGGVVEGTDCSITMKETRDGAWKISLRTGARVNATRACARLGGGGHRAASGCVIEHATLSDAKRMILSAVQEVINEENGAN